MKICLYNKTFTLIEKELFNKCYWKKIEPHFLPYTKIKYTSIKDLSVRKNLKNIWENIHLNLGSQSRSLYIKK